MSAIANAQIIAEHHGDRDAPVTFSVLIVNYNAGDYLLKTIAALSAQTRRDFEVILLDNASSDGSMNKAAEALAATGQPHTLLRSDTNLGFAAGNNRAATHARGEWLALLNPDAYPHADWLDQLKAAAARHPDAACFGSRQLQASQPDIADGAGDVVHASGFVYRGGHGWNVAELPRDDQPALAACAAAMMINRDTFEALSGFDERFFCYCEDIDLGLRLRALGQKTVQLTSAVVEHEGSAVTGEKSAFSIYHGQRNRIWLMAKHLGTIQYTLVFLPHLALNVAYLAVAFRQGTFAPAFRGLIDGYRRTLKLRRERRQPSKLSLSLWQLPWKPAALLRKVPYAPLTV